MQIAKTICLWIADRVLPVVTPGTARLDDCKIKDVFGGKGRMPGAQRVLARTSHPLGSACPCDLPTPFPVHCDMALRGCAQVVPVLGSTNGAVKIAPERLGALANATTTTWADEFH